MHSTSATAAPDTTPTDCLAAGGDTPCGVCDACEAHTLAEAERHEEPAALVGADAANDVDAPELGPDVLPVPCGACAVTADLEDLCDVCRAAHERAGLHVVACACACCRLWRAVEAARAAAQYDGADDMRSPFDDD